MWLVFALLSAVFDFIGPGNGSFLVVLLSSIADRRSVKSGSD